MARAVLLVGATLIPGCGEGLKPHEFRGETLHTIVGSARIGPDGIEEGTRYALFWTTQPEDARAWVMDPATVNELEAPSLFIMQIYQAPEVGEDGFAVGALLAWHDRDGDGRKDANEAWAGGANAAVVVYAAEPQPANGITTLPIAAGFTDMVAPLFCGARPLPIAGPECPVQTGFDCIEDEDCEGAEICRPEVDCVDRLPEGADPFIDCPQDCNRSTICVESVLNSQLPTGTCLQLELDDFDDPSMCATNTRFVPLPGGSTRRVSQHSLGIWIPACGLPDQEEACDLPGYGCSPALGICLPPVDFEVVGDRGRERLELCIVNYDDEDALDFVRSRSGAESEGEEPEGEEPEGEEPEGEEPEGEEPEGEEPEDPKDPADEEK